MKFVIIGASAFPIHGYDRATQDIDLFIQPTLANAKRTYKALENVGYDLSDLAIDTLLTKKVLLRQYILDTDVHPMVTGVTFSTIWKNSVISKWEGVPVRFASLNDLIRMKRAANRPKDVDDLRYLTTIRKLTKK